MANFKEYGIRFGTIMLAGLFLITSVGFTAIAIWQSKNDAKKQAETDSQLNQQAEEAAPQGENMLQGTKLANFTPVTDPVSELQSTDIVEGTGEAVPEGATITAHYTGAYAKTGNIFQSSKDSGQPATFSLAQVIEGWKQGVPGMKVGGTRRLVIPASMAYGEEPAGYTEESTERPMGPLVFDIELISIGESGQ